MHCAMQRIFVIPVHIHGFTVSETAKAKTIQLKLLQTSLSRVTRKICSCIRNRVKKRTKIYNDEEEEPSESENSELAGKNVTWSLK